MVHEDYESPRELIGCWFNGSGPPFPSPFFTFGEGKQYQERKACQQQFDIFYTSH